MAVKKGAKDIIPRLKKTLGAYARCESGKISKQSMLTVGAIVGGAAIGAAIASKSAKGAGIRLFRSVGKSRIIQLENNVALELTPDNSILVTHDHSTTSSSSSSTSSTSRSTSSTSSY